MAGFLDKNDRIVDMVLTGEGKRLLSVGELGFVYWRAFDDEVDYSPYVSRSGSMDDATFLDCVEEQIEATPVREATTGYRTFNLIGKDETNVHAPLFSMPHGQSAIPRMVFPEDDLEGVGVEIKQRKLTDVYESHDQDGNLVSTVGPYDRGFSRYEPSAVPFVLRHAGFSSDHRPDGFLVRVLVSGTHGYTPVSARLDAMGSVCFGPDVELARQGER